MKYCTHCGAEIDDNAVICLNCGCAVNQPRQPLYAYTDDSVSVGLVILSVLIPLFGIIYWAVKSKECPKRSRACGIAGIISWVASIVIAVIIYVSVFSSVYSYMY